MSRHAQDATDLFIIGGGVNGCGIARDAAGRGLTVSLAEMGDLASATSSASTKLFHGGLRYLEFYEFRLVREALIERETLLRAMPHISWPMRFVLPTHKDMRPAWLIRLGLFIYDNLGGRKILPGTRTLDLRTDPAGKPLKPFLKKAFEYSDCWVEDSRLVSLSARDAERLGTEVMTRTKVVSAERQEDLWEITCLDVETGAEFTRHARMLVNAGGPWVEQIVRGVARINSSEHVRLVRGSHIVTKKLFDHDRCYFFQGGDGRICFAIPYETDFTLIGTTDKDHQDNPADARCTPEEADYLRALAGEYFETPIEPEDVVWTYSGVRPLYDDGAKTATAATRDYVLSLDRNGPAMLSVFGGKITTHRRLAESALERIAEAITVPKGPWTAGAPLPGGDFPHDAVPRLIAELQAAHPFLSDFHAKRLVRAYGSEAREVVAGAASAADLGEDFGATLTEREVAWLMDREFARTAEDVVWRRTKLGLRLSEAEVARLDGWMQDRRGALGRAAE